MKRYILELARREEHGGGVEDAFKITLTEEFYYSLLEMVDLNAEPLQRVFRVIVEQTIEEKEVDGASRFVTTSAAIKGKSFVARIEKEELPQ